MESPDSMHSRGRSPRRRWTLPILALAPLLTLLSTRALARPAPDVPASTHLYIMFLPGLCPYSGSDSYCHDPVDARARATSTFHVLVAQIAAAGISYRPLFYSYDPNDPHSYHLGNTRQTLARSVDALERQLRAVWKLDHLARFDLVGHSLGGVIAASWAVTDGRRYGFHASLGLLPRVNSIVTYDSPLRGLRNPLGNTLVTRIFAGTVAYSLQPESESIKEITFFPNSWWRSRGHLHSIGNKADLVVPVAESLLGDSRVMNDRACSRDLLVFSTCHGAVLVDQALNRFVACQWITTSDLCSPRATATPTVTTGTSTPTSSSPTPVATGTAAPPAPPHRVVNLRAEGSLAG